MYTSFHIHRYLVISHNSCWHSIVFIYVVHEKGIESINQCSLPLPKIVNIRKEQQVHCLNLAADLRLVPKKKR